MAKVGDTMKFDGRTYRLAEGPYYSKTNTLRRKATLKRRGLLVRTLKVGRGVYYLYTRGR